MKRGLKDEFNPVAAPSFPTKETRRRPDGTTGFAIYDQWERGDRDKKSWKYGRVTERYRSNYDHIKWNKEKK